MKSWNSLGVCCCSCTDCCNGSFPEEFDVEFDFTDGSGTYGCETCDSDFSGTFTLQKQANCSWLYEQFAGVSYVDGALLYGNLFWCQLPYGPWYVNKRSIRLTILCISETQYKVELTYRVEAYRRVFNTTPWWGGPPWTNLSNVNVWNWQTNIDYDDFPCDSVSAYELPYSFRELFGYAYMCNQDELTMQPAILTAIP